MRSGKAGCGGSDDIRNLNIHNGSSARDITAFSDDSHRSLSCLFRRLSCFLCLNLLFFDIVHYQGTLCKQQNYQSHLKNIFTNLLGNKALALHIMLM